MKLTFAISTKLFGLFWFVFGLNNVLHLFPVPGPTPAGADFIRALVSSGYVMPIVYATETLCGLALLSGFFVPLGLLLLAPIMVNIVLYDLFLNAPGLATGAVLSVFYLVVLFNNKTAFMPFLKP